MKVPDHDKLSRFAGTPLPTGELRLASVLRQPLVAERPQFSGALEERCQYRDDSSEQGNSNVYPEHRHTLQSF